MSDPRRRAVTDEATTWLGTPYHNHARIKGVGADCAAMPTAIYALCGVIEDFDAGAYAPDWHLHQNSEEYLNLTRKYGVEVTDPQEGDFALFKFGRCFAHGGIYMGDGTVIHASRFLGVVRQPVGKGDLDRPVLYFDPFGEHE